jgi:hypothetical protein
VAFTTTLPDDQVEDGHDIVVFGGRNVALAIGQILTELGCGVDEPYAAGEHGWEFLLTFRGRHSFWCRVTSFHPAFNLLFDHSGGRPAAAKNAGAYAELATKLATALSADRRFENISWWSREEGPPEVDNIQSARAASRKKGTENPIATTGNEGGRPAWGCLALALWVTLSGVATLSLFLFAGMDRDRPGEAIFSGACCLGFGLLGLIRAWHERVEP